MLGCAIFIAPAAMTESAYTAVYCLTSNHVHHAVYNSPGALTANIHEDRPGRTYGAFEKEHCYTKLGFRKVGTWPHAIAAGPSTIDVV